MTNNDVKIKLSDAEISEYISEFEEGYLQVPLFQRDFVWDTDQKLELFRSIAKGYPIGSVLLWKPNKETLEIFENIDNKQTLGGYIIPLKNNDSLYILDGFQRLSTLIGCLIDPNKAKAKGIQRNDETWYKEFNFVYNLEVEDFEVVKVRDFSKLKWYQIPIHKLVDGKNFYYFQRTLFNENNIQAELYLKRYEEIGNKFSKYKIPNIKLHGGTISEAIEIFQKLNSQGSKITIDWVISAILIKKDPSFRLGDEITNLIKNELKDFQFHTIKREIILNCIFNSFGGVYFDAFSKNGKKIEDLIKRDDFIDITKTTFEAIKKAAKFMYEDLMILDAKLIPYSNQFIFITDFFNKIVSPTSGQLSKLKKWFWITTYSNYFTIYNLSKQRMAYQQFQKFIEDENIDPVFYDNVDTFTALSFPDKITMGSVRGKALALFMINYSANNTINLDSNPNSNVSGYKTTKLSSNKDNMIPENTVYHILPETAKILNGNDVFNQEKENLFITNEMVEMAKKSSLEQILALRKKYINQKEREFIKNALGIDYEE